MSDFELAQASAAGDAQAFEEIYHAHFRKVYCLCLRLMRSPTEAEDITQDVFIMLHRKIGTFRGDSAFSTWLYRLTFNTALMFLRQRKRQPQEEPLPEGSYDTLAERGQLKYRGEGAMIDRIALEQSISQLPVGYRTVFVLHDIQGYEHEEIARMLNIHAGTSKSQLHHARLKLRALLLGRSGGAIRHHPPSRFYDKQAEIGEYIIGRSQD